MSSNTKEWIQYGSAIFMILSGTVLSFISFFTQGTVVGGVLMYLSEALVFSGAIYGVNLYYGTKFGEFKTDTIQQIKEIFNETRDKEQSKD